MTDVHNLVWAAVISPLDNSDHSSLLAVISMALKVSNLSVSRKDLVKCQVNVNTVWGAIQAPPWHNIFIIIIII